jgi:putative FmdB family regulatory protein
MPLYEYTCPRCGEKTEILVRGSEANRMPACPVCGATMKKDWSPVAAHTKGGSGGCSAPRGGFS